MQFGLRELKLSPHVFWKLSMTEFLALSNQAEKQFPLTRTEMEQLIKNSGEKNAR